MSDTSKYQFGKSVLKKSAGDFKTFVKDRYPKLSEKDVSSLVEKHYGKDEGAEKLEESGKSAASTSKGSGSK
ncbi:hypothetical protein [Robiginitalea biformata]|uniref:Uncharacterized protein n=1 Tax=Robiginitalea biformata (strain ATCC BAA-864 / DSM 15991 / KCTC 12146 / HTCC2501) TaxID=313596 RepID=A4CP58_ROBBH|nr:hypothetical protein [Robiginitalea biformata]EAR14675.1 hypothetical protein RB2501_01326 [Robiginitalea biformata HTCC2501]